MEATTAAPSRARVLQALRSRNFRLLWTGQAVSMLGDTAFLVGLGSANALIGMARQGSLLVGPSLAGLLYGFAGSTVVFGFNAASFLVSFAFVWATRPRVAERAAAEGTLREIGAGFRYVARFPWLWLTISLFAFVLMLQWAPIQVLTPKLVRQHMLSRVVSLDWFDSLGLTPFGLLLVGAISGLAPTGEIITAGPAISMCIIACGLFSKQI